MNQLKNMTPLYTAYFECSVMTDEVRKRLRENREFYEFTKTWCAFEGIVAAGWYPEQRLAVIVANIDGRKRLSKEFQHTQWRTTDGCSFRIEIRPE